MFYDAELQFLRNACRKLGLQTLLIDPEKPLDPRINLGLGKILGHEEFYEKSFYDLHPPLESNRIYRLCDHFSCQYLFLLLPETEEESILVIGPYLTKEMSRTQFLEKAENNAIHPQQLRHLEKFYGMVPLIAERSHIFVLLEAFYDLIWGSGTIYSIQDVQEDSAHKLSPIMAGNAPIHTEKTNWNIDVLEERYRHENELMEAVASGQPHKAEYLLATFSTLPFEKRVDDPIRNLRNYSIIINTLLRKAAERGGVHPVYLDSASSSFARKIELQNTAPAIESLIKEMFQSYCQMVQKHRTKDYSMPVQRTIVQIETALSEDLTLTKLAASQNLSPGYLSALFHKETGQTLSSFINQRRVEAASYLLTHTNLQVQTIAQHCGMVDVHYFSKVFKKVTGMTPKIYRQEAKKAAN